MQLHVMFVDLSQFRPVYAPKDFLEVISNIKNPNIRDSGFAGSYVEGLSLLNCCFYENFYTIFLLAPSRNSVSYKCPFRWKKFKNWWDQVLLSMRSRQWWLRFNIDCSVLSLQRLQFSDLSMSEAQTGIDDNLDYLSESYEQERIKIAKKGSSFYSIFVIIFQLHWKVKLK